MTNAEAKAIMENLIYLYRPLGDSLKAWETAIEALEKQVPYEPKLKKNSGHYWGKCKCTDHIVYNLDKSRYCENCGQLLKGRDEDE